MTGQILDLTTEGILLRRKRSRNFAGVGAVCLRKQQRSKFADGRTSDGMMRTSSIFLRENGASGTIHHIDLSI